MSNELNPSRLRSILSAYPSLRVGVVGDFFLDAYFDCEPELNEISLETGRTCYQVVRHRRQAGAAGTVAANLRALGVGAVEAVGYCGDDGEGYELRRAMQTLGLHTSGSLYSNLRQALLSRPQQKRSPRNKRVGTPRHQKSPSDPPSATG